MNWEDDKTSSPFFFTFQQFFETIFSSMETTFLPSFYSQFMQNTPLLTRQEEIELSSYLHGDCEKKRQKAIDKFVESNMKLAVKIVLDEYFWFTEKEDLVSEAIMGLQQAAKKYDYTLGAKFSTYSAYYIRRRIYDYINRSSMIRMSTYGTTMYMKIQKVIKRLGNELGREANTEEIGEELGLSSEKVEEFLNYKYSYTPLDAPIQNSNGNKKVTISETIRDENAISPDKEVEKRNDLKEANDFFNGLNERERFILRKRFGFDGEEPMILEDIGQMLNVTRERVRQLQDAALKKIKKRMKDKNSSLHSMLVLA